MRTMPLSANEDRNLIANRAQPCSVKDWIFCRQPPFLLPTGNSKADLFHESDPL